jgi:glycerol-3-phosphate dehydrogenase (NAD(P)+)
MTRTIDTASTRIGVIGAGSWGTSLANLLAQKGFDVDLWTFESEIKEQIETGRENTVFLPGFRLADRLRASTNLEQVTTGKDLLLVVVPSHFLRDVTSRMAPWVSPDTIVVSASKGIENKTHLTMSKVLQETLSHLPEDRFAVLSGPSFAREVTAGMPTLVTIASPAPETASYAQQVFVTPVFRVYTINDMIGVELGGAVKNVIAIASGIVDGLGLGLNTRAALITRGLSEIRRLGLTLGADPLTFTGLAGVGDLMLTCTGNLSRNHTVGEQIGQGKKLKDILANMRMVAEGVRTAKSVYNLSRKINVEMPISREVYRVLYEDRPPAEAVKQLMTRDLRHELDDQY